MAEKRKRCVRCESYQIAAEDTCQICGFDLNWEPEPAIPDPVQQPAPQKPAAQTTPSKQPDAAELPPKIDLEEMKAYIDEVELETKKQKKTRRIFIGILIAFLIVLVIRVVQVINTSAEAAPADLTGNACFASAEMEGEMP